MGKQQRPFDIKYFKIKYYMGLMRGSFKTRKIKQDVGFIT